MPIKQIVLCCCLFLFGYDAFAQVAKNIIVEHFTNTWCAVCASRNPPFYENLNKQSGVLHISYHPSKPYPNCELHQHNSTENDGRAKYYRGIYGATPRLVIQGAVLSRFTDYADPAIFEPYLAETSPLRIKVSQINIEDRLIEVQLKIYNEVAHDLTNVKIMVGLAEKRVQLDAPNGENEHYDVFRKAFTNIEGDLIKLQKAQGMTKVVNYQIPINEAWDLEELFSYVILQEEEENTKAVIQAFASQAGDFSVPVNIADEQQNALVVFPNPVLNQLHINSSNQKINYLKIYNSTGKLSTQTSFMAKLKVDMTAWNKGLYLIEIEQSGEHFYRKILKK